MKRGDVERGHVILSAALVIVVDDVFSHVVVGPGILDVRLSSSVVDDKHQHENYDARRMSLVSLEYPFLFLFFLMHLVYTIPTENDQKADQDGCQSSHAELQCLSLLYELAVLTPETVWADTSVSEAWILIDTSTAVQARIIYALVLVHASFVIGRWNPSFSTSENLGNAKCFK